MTKKAPGQSGAFFCCAGAIHRALGQKKRKSTIINRKERKGRKEEGTNHEGTKNSKGSDVYFLKLRELCAFVVGLRPLLLTLTTD